MLHDKRKAAAPRTSWCVWRAAWNEPQPAWEMRIVPPSPSCVPGEA